MFVCLHFVNKKTPKRKKGRNAKNMVFRKNKFFSAVLSPIDVRLGGDIRHQGEY
jgi:hypothetical protein